MNWMTILWPMVAAACITMALINLRIGLHRSPRAAHLLFSLNACVVAVYSCFELALVRTDSPARYLELLRGLDMMAGALVASLAAFVWVFFGTGRKWLALLGPGLTCAALIADLLPVPKLVFLHISSIGKMETFGGATYTVAEGVASPWNVVFYLGVLLLLVFVADASVTLWRQGTRRRAAVVGGSITFFVLFAGVQAALVDTGIMRTPYLVSFAYLAILVAMGFELSRDAMRAMDLARGLRENEQRLRLVVAAAPTALIMVNAEGRITLANVRAEAIFGYSREELEGQLIEVLVPDSHRSQHQAFRDAYGANPTARSMGAGRDLFGRCKDGRQFPAEIGLNPIQTSDGPMVLASVIDLTERRRREAEASEQRNELFHLSRVTMLGELSGSLAHELNQPLTAILSNAQAAQRFMAEEEPDLKEVREIMADIVKDDQRAGEIIRRLRLLLRKGEIKYQSTDVNEVVLDVIKLIHNDLVNHGILLRTELVDGLPLAACDRVQIQQVLVNIIVNGYEAMDAASSPERVLFVCTSADDHRVRVSVTDSGSGIPADTMDRILQPFFTTKNSGMGLGLSVCRSIITAHGGEIWAENNARRGATFHFTLPVADTKNSKV